MNSPIEAFAFAENMISAWCKNRSADGHEILLVKKLRAKLDSDQILFVLRTLDSICPMCGDSEVEEGESDCLCTTEE